MSRAHQKPEASADAKRRLDLIVGRMQKRCADCGVFVTKDRWIEEGAPRNAKPLCAECYSEYDDPNFL